MRAEISTPSGLQIRDTADCKSALQLLRLVGLLAASSACALSAFSAGTNLVPVADTMIMAIAPTNNAGGLAWFTCGGNHYGMPSRGLLRFDIAGAIPPGSRITGASLSLYVVATPGDGYEVGYFDLHRLLRAWGEGTNKPPSAPGQGSPATLNEATWYSPLALTTNFWSAPGAAATNDYDPRVTASQIVYDTFQSPYQFPGPSDDPAPMLADVQRWLDAPASNYGWIFICESETSANTTRRFGSREDPNHAPDLGISFIAAPRINFAAKITNTFLLSFTAWPDQAYAVEFTGSPALLNWQTLTNLTSPTNQTEIVITDLLTSTQRFYRVTTQ
jgi:hypothetical protein